MKLLIFAFVMGYICASVKTKALTDTLNFSGGPSPKSRVSRPQPQKHEAHTLSESEQQHKEMQEKLDFQYRQYEKQYPNLHANKVKLLPPMSHAEAMDLLVRISRAPAKKGQGEEPPAPKACKYRKGTWSACDPDSKVRIRTDTLRRGDSNICESMKTRKKDCKPNKKAKQRNNSKGRANKLKKE